MKEEKMCSCWEGSLIDWWSRTCKGDTVVDVSNGAKPVRSHHSTNIKKNPGVQIMLSPHEGGNNSSAYDKEEELKQGSKIRVFTYNELRTATRNFRADNALGEGGFGVVYKGWIGEMDSARTKVSSGFVVAVKVLNQEGMQGHREWLAEVNFLGQLEHPHLVKLIGYCCEGEHRLLVYEFMPRGSLENHLFRSK